MKRIVPLLLILLIVLPSCSINGRGDNGTVPAQTATDVVSVLQNEFVTEDTDDGVFTFLSNTTNKDDTTLISSGSATASRTSSKTKVSKVTTTKKATKKPTTTKKSTTKPATTKPATTKPAVTATTAAQPAFSPSPSKELRGIWLSCYDFPSAQGKTQVQFAAACDTIFKNISSLGLNAAFVHVRAFSDSFYPSTIFPWSQYVSGVQGKSPGYDTLAIMISCAKKYNIAFHAWINPFRVSFSTDYTKLCSSNPARKIIESGNKTGDVCILTNGIYYCPASTAMHNLILSGVKEILEKYDVDGIHIDDYFYPSTSVEVDKIQYKNYLACGGKLTLSQWRMSCVNSFVSALYKTVKTYGSGITVSISPSGIIADNKTKQYADVVTWLSRTGYADIVIPQIYFGFQHPTVPFLSTLKSWAALKTNTNVRLACGLAAYKCGVKDANAGAACNEWIDNNNMLKRQVQEVAKNGKCSGFVLFSYSSMFCAPTQAMKNEIANLKTIL